MKLIMTKKQLILALSIGMLIYWFLSKVIDVYQITIVGVFYEILWFPMMVLIVLLPILNSYFIFKEPNKLLNYISLTLNVVTFVIVSTI
jgi:hypothetical protein